MNKGLKEGMMAMETGSDKKEATILGLSLDIQKLLFDFRERLDNRFDRSTKPESEIKEAPVIPNVLDEIIETLELNIAHLSSIMSFISSNVLPKIS